MSKPRTFEEAIDKIFAEQKAIMVKKQRDYGHKNITSMGELGVLVRVNDKIARLKNLVIGKRKPKNEAIEDSWRDLLNYALIALMLKSGIFTLPLKEDLNERRRGKRCAADKTSKKTKGDKLN